MLVFSVYLRLLGPLSNWGAGQVIAQSSEGLSLWLRAPPTEPSLFRVVLQVQNRLLLQLGAAWYQPPLQESLISVLCAAFESSQAKIRALASKFWTESTLPEDIDAQYPAFSEARKNV